MTQSRTTSTWYSHMWKTNGLGINISSCSYPKMKMFCGAAEVVFFWRVRYFELSAGDFELLSCLSMILCNTLCLSSRQSRLTNKTRDEQPCLCFLCLCSCYFCSSSCHSFHKKIRASSRMCF
ncbi:unnamed protein product [Vicia faba]|uniref:Uncharacterized protein n=1 Tax=Vicia faba TaxID=3906 RepID=A0AAV1A043_VICFA|nr:unnamed protein product [Vicia faba]